jgi:hypothetical protein
MQTIAPAVQTVAPVQQAAPVDLKVHKLLSKYGKAPEPISAPAAQDTSADIPADVSAAEQVLSEVLSPANKAKKTQLIDS